MQVDKAISTNSYTYSHSQLKGQALGLVSDRQSKRAAVQSRLGKTGHVGLPPLYTFWW
jgi:hypothetical protein